ncbi:unnamed protein product [Adineta ricciae]|uniref:G-protein coupled receptors family 1 profile domain-containing protein n=1 Tax=Adineta ricciae TaxID=249248 RepID=A0A814SK27_ADIRI|nr:unnamed protein product [Adineta ricciae]CAF1149159.1 unnamed protein product [Adineta ricciae]
MLCSFTVLGNLFIIYVIIRKRTLHTSKYYYIISLAFADLIVGLIVMPFSSIFILADDEYWLFSPYLRFLCDIWHAIDIFASTASILGLCTIGIDRYVVIKKPIQYPTSFISKRWHLMLSFTWVCSALISFPAILYWGTKQPVLDDTPVSLLEQCDMPNNAYYILFSAMASFYIPLFLMIYVYVKIYLAARNQTLALYSGYKHQHHRIRISKSVANSFHQKESSSEENTKLDLSQVDDQIILRIHRGTYQKPKVDVQTEKIPAKRRKCQGKFWRTLSNTQKATSFIGLVMGTFLFCWFPYFFYLVLSGAFNVRLKNDHHHEVLYNILTWLGYSNSALDIIVYVSTSAELRTAFFEYLFYFCIEKK